MIWKRVKELEAEMRVSKWEIEKLRTYYLWQQEERMSAYFTTFGELLDALKRETKSYVFGKDRWVLSIQKALPFDIGSVLKIDREGSKVLQFSAGEVLSIEGIEGNVR